MIVRNGINCNICKKKYPWLQGKYSEVIMHFFDNKRKEIRFYPSVFSEELCGGHVKILKMRLKKMHSEQMPGHFDYLVSCPLCGKFTLRYPNVPPDWDVCVGSTKGLTVISIPCDDVVLNMHRKDDDIPCEGG